MSTSPVALVTGAATGIGKATALAYAHAGCDVVIADINSERLKQLAHDIQEIGVDALAVTTDVSDIEQVNALHEKIMAHFGRLDYACNNAGIEGENAPTGESTLENYDRVMNINVRGLYACMQAQLKIMEKQGKGAIVNMASVAGLIGFPGLPAYCASKGAVVQLSKTAAVEYAEKGVRVNAVCPGAIKTEMIDRITRQDPETEKQFAALHPMNRMGTSEEVANAVLFLTLPSSSFITGQMLAVDGGMVAR
ncbi:glucose 1-dehydrogenase [Aliidiomarina sanyensis]|uniref:Short chain dehydrogenase n=1 Tax=Aliidiomarina sanyensis TaxID=1249555 RepID=A0A432WNN7_9GAMM|nr:glucose 1-dehydrogenase [Aliidiomarina sanyensis]RUO35412.1 short chain dehydrogenase [Aliidiomarina sanyensis]